MTIEEKILKWMQWLCLDNREIKAAIHLNYKLRKLQIKKHQIKYKICTTIKKQRQQVSI